MDQTSSELALVQDAFPGVKEIDAKTQAQQDWEETIELGVHLAQGKELFVARVRTVQNDGSWALLGFDTFRAYLDETMKRIGLSARTGYRWLTALASKELAIPAQSAKVERKSIKKAATPNPESSDIMSLTSASGSQSVVAQPPSDEKPVSVVSTPPSKTTFSHNPTANVDAYLPAVDWKASYNKEKARRQAAEQELERVKTTAAERYSTLKAHVKALEAENEQLRTRVEVGF